MARQKITARARRPRPVARSTSGDVITVQNVGAGAAVAAGRQAKASVSAGSLRALEDWAAQLKKQVDAMPGASPAEKADIKQQVDKVKEEGQKGARADTGRIERLLNGLAAMAPDIFEVAIATLASPLAGFGLVAKKIGDRAKLERTASPG